MTSMEIHVRQDDPPPGPVPHLTGPIGAVGVINAIFDLVEPGAGGHARHIAEHQVGDQTVTVHTHHRLGLTVEVIQ